MAARTPADVALGPDHFLRFGTFAFSLMEKELGKPISQIFAQAGPDEKNTFELRTMTTLLWSGITALRSPKHANSSTSWARTS